MSEEAMVENDLTGRYAPHRYWSSVSLCHRCGRSIDDSGDASRRAVQIPVSALHACVTAANGVDHRTGDLLHRNRC